MGRFAVISMTEKAAERVREIMATRENAYGIRVGVKKGGCAGMEYTIDLVTEPNPKDDHIERDGAHVYVAPEAALFLLGTEMDFESPRCAPDSPSTIRTRARPAAAANRSS